MAGTYHSTLILSNPTAQNPFTPVASGLVPGSTADPSAGTVSAPAPAYGGSYYNSTLTSGIVLSNPTTQNPATIAASGYITNTTLQHNGDAVYGSNATAWTISNFGTIAGNPTSFHAAGIWLTGGGTVVNGHSGSSAGLIAAHGYAVDIFGGRGIVINYGTIAAVSQDGVKLAGGAVVNSRGGVISGAAYGIADSSVANPLTIANAGIIEASGAQSAGIHLAATGGSLSNAAGGLISGVRFGVELSLSATLTNSGTIAATGTNGVGIDVAKYAAAAIDNISGASIQGGLSGVEFTGTAGRIVNFGVIQGGSAGLIAYANSTVTNFGTIIGAAGMTIDAATLTSFGTISGTTDTDTIVNHGTIIGSAGVGVALHGPATLIDDGMIAGAGTAVAFGYGAELLAVGSGASLSGTLAMFKANDTIDLAGVVANGSTYQSGVLVLTQDGSAVAQLALSTPTHNPQFALLPDGTGGTLVTVSPGSSSNYYNGVVSDGIVLRNPTIQNPTTIGPNGYVTRSNAAYYGAALYGTTAAAWTLANHGTLVGGSALLSADAVRLLAGGVVTNGQSGTSGGLISASKVAIEIAGAAGTVANYGTILGADTGGTSGDGVDLANGGRIVNGATNANAALISGFDGVRVDGGSTVVNYGTIASTGTATRFTSPPYGVDFTSGPPGGGVRNAAGGLIAGGVDVFSGSISNYGTILGTVDATGVLNAAGALFAGSVTAATLSNFGSITATANADGLMYNAPGAYVAGVSGVGGPGQIATINNFGIITGKGKTSAAVAMASNSGVSVYNAPAALIQAYRAGIAIGFNYAFSEIDNSGTIAGLGTTRGIGVYIASAGDGRVTNRSGAIMSGGSAGVQVFSQLGTVSNFGTIAGIGGNGTGIYLSAGTITNYGVVEAGSSGFGVQQKSGTVTNFGTVLAGSSGVGIGLYSGNVTNYGAILAPGATAVYIQHGTFFNDGLVEGIVTGIVLSPGTSAVGSGMVTVAGTVVGATGISAASPAGTSQTLTVAGAVTGTGGTAVSLTPGGSDRMILDPGAVFQGVVDGGGGGVLEIAAGAGSGPAGRGRGAAGGAYVSLGSVVNFSALQIDPSATLDNSGALSFATLVNQGQINVASGDSLALGTVASAAATGVIDLRAGGMIHFQGPVASQTLIFNPAGGTALIDQPAAFAATIPDFAVNDTIDLALGTASNPQYSGGVLSLSYGGTTVALNVATPYVQPQFLLSSDNNGGTDITVAPAPATVASVEASPPGGDLDAGNSIAITVTMDGPVTVAGGAPTLSLNDGGTATYSPTGSTATALVFSGTVGTGQNAAALAVTAVNLNGATITDGNGNSADLSGAAVTFGGLEIDTTAPATAAASLTVPGNSAATPIGIAAPSDANDSAAALTVTVTGLPTDGTVLLSDGTTAVFAGESLSVAQLTGLEFQPAANLFSQSSTLTYTVADPAGNTTPGNATLAIESAPPGVSAVTASPPGGDLDAGNAIAITVNMDGPVTVAGGAPTLSLNDGGTATYSPTGSTATALVFSGTVGAGQNAAALAVTAVNLNGATITDGNGNSADLSGAAVTFGGLEIDTTAPATAAASLTVPGNSAATPIGIAAPSDANDSAAALTVTVTGLPTDGTVLLSDGTTAVFAGESLSVAQLTGLEFQPAANLFGQSSTLAYTVADPAGNTTPSNATLAIQNQTACYCRGTLILTDRGEVPVEELAIGDRVMTISGAAKPVRWIGWRRYDGRFVAGNRAVLPICIEAGAIAEGVPARDLFVSPEHALYIDDALVPAGHLVNGATIVRAERVERVEYFNIEFDEHEIILAEGAPAESYTDCDNRLMFANGADYARLYPQDARPRWQFCARRLDDASPELTGIRARLFERAEALGYRLTDDPQLHLIVDDRMVRPESVAGRIYRFHLPVGSGAVWLASRSAVPAEIDGAGCDIRRLGVAVERIALCDGNLSIDAWHGHAGLSNGFHDDEDGHRWSNGLARLPETWRRSFPGGATLDVHLIATDLRYRLPPPSHSIAAA